MAFYAQWSEKTRGYVVAVVACAAALVLRLIMLSLLGDRAPFFPFVLAVLVAAWHGGLKPGLLATGVGAILGDVFFSESSPSSPIMGGGREVSIALFMIIGISASFVCEALHAARRRVEEKQRELQRIQNELQEADRRKDEFLAVLAHELRNPLAPLSNAVQIMRHIQGDVSQMNEMRGLMERQIRHMVRLVDDLLDVSRLTTGKLNLRMERVKLADAIKTAVEVVRPLIDELDHEFITSLPADPIELEGDSIRLAQIIANLLNNAAKYTEKKGRISLTAERDGKVLVVSVRDTGIGIAAENLPLIFRKFSQVSSALDRSHGGLGIGLSLVHGLVELHDGSVEARSGGNGRGSEFIVRLPIPQDSLRSSPEPGGNGQLSSAGSKFCIVVVDDNRDAADSLAMMLRHQGYQIHVAHNGLDAIQAAATVQPRAVLLDIGMPQMNGYEVARHIREQPWGREMTLIALTGWGQQEDQRKAAEAGFNHHLTKPADLAVLGTYLERLAQIPITAPNG